jgi:hypothetical protein
MTAPQNPAPVEAAAAEGDRPHRWTHRVGALLYIFFCFEVGAFLVLFPWTDAWNRSFFSGLTPGWYEIWISPYLRGAISGLGVVDIGIAFVEVFRLRRPSEASDPSRSLQ